LYQEILIGYDKLTNTQHWFIGIKEVCKNFYVRACGKLRTSIEKCQQEFVNSRESYLHAVDTETKYSSKKNEDGLKRDQISAWLRMFSKAVGDKMPHEDVLVLPYRQINAIYEEYEDDMKFIGEDVASNSWFNIVFNDFCNDNKTRLCRDTGTFVTCTVCDAYHARLRAATTPSERQQLKALRRKHLDKQRQQRELYYQHKLRAMMFPKKYLSIIVDGMDQKKTDCPVMGRYVKDEAPLVQRIIGVKVHGLGNYVYVADESVPGGSNLILEVLNRTLLDLDAKGLLPTDPESVFYLQVDNCGENKNRTMFAYLTDLVRRGVFSKIRAGFLMVGHTHEDIDQFFSVIALYLKQLHVVCPDQPSLLEGIRDAFADSLAKPEVVVLSPREIFDYKMFYDPVIDESLAYHQEPHQYRFKLFHDPTKEDTVVLVHYKMWAQSTTWLPAPSCANSDVTQTVQTSVESEVAPNKKRKMTRHSTSKGQIVSQLQVKKSISTKSVSNTTSHEFDDIPENVNFNCENPLVVNDAAVPAIECSVNSGPKGSLRGILWIKDSPDLLTATRLQFDESTVQKNLKRSTKIFNDIRTKFLAK
jgi:hypothetical protein